MNSWKEKGKMKQLFFYEEKSIAEKDWHAEEMEALESNQE